MNNNDDGLMEALENVGRRLLRIEVQLAQIDLEVRRDMLKGMAVKLAKTIEEMEAALNKN
jgi:hypothetical protein